MGYEAVELNEVMLAVPGSAAVGDDCDRLRAELVAMSSCCLVCLCMTRE